MRAHPYADKFPMLPADELAELAESIRANGLRQPIVLDTEGRILDGRNRLAACEKAGVAPEFVTYKGEDLAEYVIDCNTSRRHMSTGARAMASALILEADGRRENGRFAYGEVNFADSQNPTTYRSMVSRAGVVIDYAPHLAQGVVNGDLALDNAYQQAKDIKASAEAEKLAERNRAKAEREAEKASVLQTDIPVSIDHNLIPADMHTRIVRPIEEPEFEPGAVLGKISQPSSEPDFMLKSGNQTNDLLNSLSLLCQDLTDLCLSLRKLTDACVMRIDQCECPRR